MSLKSRLDKLENDLLLDSQHCSCRGADYFQWTTRDESEPLIEPVCNECSKLVKTIFVVWTDPPKDNSVSLTPNHEKPEMAEFGTVWQ